jgi:hypothetical protein
MPFAAVIWDIGSAAKSFRHFGNHTLDLSKSSDGSDDVGIRAQAMERETR